MSSTMYYDTALGKSLFLGICYAFALCSAVQEEMVALATLFE